MYGGENQTYERDWRHIGQWFADPCHQLILVISCQGQNRVAVLKLGRGTQEKKNQSSTYQIPWQTTKNMTVKK